VAAEYAALEAAFGPSDGEWKVLERRVIKREDGAAIEKFILNVRGRRTEIYFDISKWYAKPPAPSSEAVMRTVFGRMETVPVSVSLPGGHLAVLASILLSQKDRFKDNRTFDFENITQSVAEICVLNGIPDVETGLSDGRMVTLEMSLLEWTGVHSLLRLVQTADLAFDERIQDLMAYIWGAIHEASPKAR